MYKQKKAERMKKFLEEKEREKEHKLEKKILDMHVKLNKSQRPGSMLGTELKIDPIQEEDLEQREDTFINVDIDRRHKSESHSPSSRVNETRTTE
mgnify:CR=1 FL=1